MCEHQARHLKRPDKAKNHHSRRELRDTHPCGGDGYIIRTPVVEETDICASKLKINSYLRYSLVRPMAKDCHCSYRHNSLSTRRL